MVNERGRVSWSGEVMTTKDAQGAQTRCSQGGGAVQAANFKASRTCGPGVLLGWARAYVREES